jgi:TolB protein
MRSHRRIVVLLTVAGWLLSVLCLPAPVSAAALGKNGLIAFERDGNIYTIRPDGTGLKQLTRTHEDSWPAWSPDGRKLAFSRGGDLHIMRPDGTGISRITTHPGEELEPTWSPDGKQLAFSHQGVDDIYGVARVRISAPQDFIWVREGDDCFGAYGPDWSPDGALIALIPFDCYSDYGGLNIVDARTGEYALDSMSCWYGCLSVDFSPDGSALAYDPEYNSNMIFTAAPGDEDSKQLTRDEYWQASEPAWSPDGRLIAFAGYWYRDGQIGEESIYVMDAHTGRGKRLVVRNADTPSWQPAA